MGISEANFRRSVDALDEYVTHQKDRTYTLRLVEENGEKYLQCYDTGKVHKEGFSSDVIEFYQKLRSKYPDLDMLAYPESTWEKRKANVQKDVTSELGKNLIDPESKNVDYAEKDNTYFSKLTFSGRIKYKKLESSYKNREELQKNQEMGFLEDLAERISSFFKELWKNSFFFTLTDEYNEFIMTQENLIDRGTFNFLQKDIFLDLIKDEDEPEFKDLSNGMQKLHSLEGNVIKSYLTINHSGVPEKMWEDFQALDLNENKSMWIDLGSCPGEHSMKGRIVRVGDDEYRFQMSNTGAGIDKYPLLHKTGRRDGKEVYQTVVEWSFTKNELQPEFFKKLIDATVFGTPANGVKEEASQEDVGKYGEAIAPISAVYSVILDQFPDDHLVDKPLNDPINASYWSSEQIGPSCVPYSNWSLARVVLKPEQYQKLRTEARIRYFQRNYKKIASGEDTSLSSLLHASEQVSALLTEAKGRNIHLFKAIQNDISDRFIEKALINEAPFDWDGLPQKTEITMRDAKLSKSGRSHVVVEFEELTNDGKPIKFQIERDENQEPTGLITLSYLLYEAILSGHADIISTYVDKFVDFINKHPDPSEISINIGLEDFNQFMYAFYHLAERFQAVDGTIASRQKQLQIVNIAETIHTVLFTKALTAPKIKELGADTQQRMANALEFYRIFDTGKHLNPDNNYWANVSIRLRPWEFASVWNAYHIRNNFVVNDIKQKKFNENIEIPVYQQDQKTIPFKSFTFTANAETDDNSLNIEVNDSKEIELSTDEKEVKLSDLEGIELPLAAVVENSLDTESLEGKAYLVYYYFCTGQTDKLLMAITYLNHAITFEPVTHPDLLIWIAKNLKNASDSLRTLDKSKESLLLQQSMQYVSLAIFQFIVRKSEELKLSNSHKDEIKRNVDEIIEWFSFYSAIDANSYIDDNQLKSMYRTCKQLFDRWRPIEEV